MVLSRVGEERWLRGSVPRAERRAVAVAGSDGLFGHTLEALKAGIQVGLHDLENGRCAVFKLADGLADQTGGRRDALLASAVADLGAGPDLAGSLVRDGMMKGLRTRRIAPRGRRASHSRLYGVAGPNPVEVVRILHDRMDFRRCTPPDST